MLSLQSTSSERWLGQVERHLDEILIDHAHCEKTAAGTALNPIFAYVENEDLCRAMTEIVNEELAHFHLVLDLLRRRGRRRHAELAAHLRMFVCVAPTDMRRQFDGLHDLVASVFGRDVFEGHVFLFFKRRRDRVKALWWDRDWLAIFARRLE